MFICWLLCAADYGYHSAFDAR